MQFIVVVKYVAANYDPAHTALICGVKQFCTHTQTHIHMHTHICTLVLSCLYSLPWDHVSFLLEGVSEISLHLYAFGKVTITLDINYTALHPSTP